MSSGGEQPPPPQWGGGPAGSQPPPGQPGQAYPGYPGYGYPYGRMPGTNGFAIAALVCAFVCSPLGLVFGIIARNQIRRTGQDGDGLALAGIIVSAVSIALAILWLVFVIAVFSSGGTSVHFGTPP